MNLLEHSTSILSSIGTNADVAKAFNFATFVPQPLWLLMIVAPKQKLTKTVMEPLFPLILFSLCHLFIVIVSATQVDETAPIAEFANVFDPAGDPLKAMIGMMDYPNFVSGEIRQRRIITIFLSSRHLLS
jgi:hypothetical protein